jgi:hypothetical protein
LGIRGALAIVERRWGDARDALEFLSTDAGGAASERCGYLIAAGDIAVLVERNAEAGQRFYTRARAQSPGDPRLIGRGERADGAFTEELARDNTDEIPR